MKRQTKLEAQIALLKKERDEKLAAINRKADREGPSHAVFLKRARAMSIRHNAESRKLNDAYWPKYRLKVKKYNKLRTPVYRAFENAVLLLRAQALIRRSKRLIYR